MKGASKRRVTLGFSKKMISPFTIQIKRILVPQEQESLKSGKKSFCQKCFLDGAPEKKPG